MFFIFSRLTTFELAFQSCIGLVESNGGGPNGYRSRDGLSSLEFSYLGLDSLSLGAHLGVVSSNCLIILINPSLHHLIIFTYNLIVFIDCVPLLLLNLPELTP